MEFLIWVIVGVIVGAGGAFLFLKKEESKKIIEEEKKLLHLKQDVLKTESEIKNKQLELKEERIKAEDASRQILSKAKEEAQELKIELEKSKTRAEEKEENLEKKEKELDKKVELLEQLKEAFKEKEETLAQEKEKIKKALEEQSERLAEIGKMSKDEARDILLKIVEKESKDVLLKQIEIVERDLKEDAQKRAQDIVVQAIQRYAGEVATEKMTTIVELPNDELKGRIIGREGRNINTIEQVTGVDIIVDDTPNAIMISGFDLLRRYIAKTLIEKLLEDGRIHPARIEELAEKVFKDTSIFIKEVAEKALMDIGISGLHPDLVKIIGRLHFRTSYGQNQLKHAVEVGHIAGLIATQIGYDIEKAKLAGFLHDIGKAVDHQIEGTHTEIGYTILKKYKIDEEVTNAVRAHHGDVPSETNLGFIVCAADAISGARPGARKESLDAYIKRLQNLEEIATSFPGVQQAYAIQAGREVRIIVSPSEVDDYGAKKLSLDIAQKIEEELNYPGQIKVHVIRDLREISFAK